MSLLARLVRYPLSPRRRRSIRPAAATAALTVAAAGSLFAVATQGTSQAAVQPNGFKSVGYMPSWAGSVTGVQYAKLTHINYAFALPNANGTLQAIENTSKLSQLVSLGHQNNVKVSLAIGGWNNGNDSAFESLAGNAGARTTFVNSVMNTVRQYNLDGIDIDWEYPDPGQSATNYTILMQQLSTALHNEGKLLTAAVVSEGGTANGVQPAVFAVVDWLNIMAYDGGSPHANYDWSINAANFWKNRGLPKTKTVLGVPFYSRPGYYTYAQLVAMDPANANRDCTSAGGAQQCYNGLPTIRRKTQWAMANAAGIMNWELSQDATGANSLVTAIYEVATSGGGPTTPPSTSAPPGGGVGKIRGVASGKCVDVAGASTVNGTQVQLYTCDVNGAAQAWTIGSDGTVRALGKCLDVAGGVNADGTRVQIWDCFAGNQNQQWRYSSAAQSLVNPLTGKCLDATGQGTADRTPLQIWSCNGQGNQRWTIPA